VPRGGPTVRAYLDDGEPAHTRDLEEATRAKIRHLLQPVREMLGERRYQTVVRSDIDGLVDRMMTRGPEARRQTGNRLSARTIADTLAIF
jgi:hypothetical protein